MIEWPPGEPITMASFPFSSNTMAGAIELRGRFFASTRLATGLPASSGAQEKSVGSLFKKNPRTICRLPKAASTPAESATACASPSTIANRARPRSEVARAGGRSAGHAKGERRAVMGLSLARRVRGEFGFGELAWSGFVPPNRGGDVGGDLAVVEGVRAARRDALQYRGEFRVF